MNRRTTTIRLAGVAVLLSGAGLLAGCNLGRRGDPLKAESFLAPRVIDTRNQEGRAIAGRAAPLPIDRSGPLYDNVGIDALETDEERLEREAGPPVTRISKTVQESVDSPRKSEPAAAARRDAPDDAPAAAAGEEPNRFAVKPDDPNGQAVFVGTVLARVDQEPIYADKVIAALESPLAAEAKRMGPKAFQQVAAQMIQEQLRAFVNAELEFAAAQRRLTERDKLLAKALTEDWRNKQIVQAGGAIEQARRRAAEQGADFDELVDEQYRVFLTRIYYEKLVMPLIQVSAKDMRRYYEQHKEEFSQEAGVRFRTLNVDPAKLAGGATEARAAAERLRKDLAAGKDFAEVAAAARADAQIRKALGEGGGDRFFKRGSYRLQKVEDAVWKVAEVGGVTPVIDEGGAFHVARLDDRNEGAVEAFEEPQVQEKIKEKLRSEQFNELRRKLRQDLEKGAIITVNEKELMVALDMAMQRYPQWAPTR